MAAAEPDENVERAVRGRRLHPVAEAGEGVEEQLAVRGEPLDARAAVLDARLQAGEGRVLGDGGGADDVRVLDLEQGLHEPGRERHVADPPARESVGLAERPELDGVRLAPRDRAGREVPRPIVHEVLVRLVVEVVETALRAQGVHRPEVRFGVGRAARVVGRGGRDRAGTRTGGRRDRLQVELVVRAAGHDPRHRPGHPDRHLVIEEVGPGEDDLVARIGDRDEGVQKAHVRARGDHDLPPRRVDPVLPGELLPDGGTKLGGPLVRLVEMVGGRLAEPGDPVRDPGRRAVSHHSLPEGYGAGVAAVEVHHDRDDRRLHGREPGGDRGRKRLHGGAPLRKRRGACRPVQATPDRRVRGRGRGCRGRARDTHRATRTRPRSATGNRRGASRWGTG